MESYLLTQTDVVERLAYRYASELIDGFAKRTILLLARVAVYRLSYLKQMQRRAIMPICIITCYRNT
jgi:hypothetical protein